MSLLISLGLQSDDSHMNNMNIYKGVDLDKYKIDHIWNMLDILNMY